MAEKMMKTIFDWEDFTVYLSGAMDFANDGGKGWRDEWTERLIQIGINPKHIYNPCRKPFSKAHVNLNNERAIAQQCRSNKDWEQLNDLMGQIMHIDLRLVDKADLILVNMPKINWNNKFIHDIKACGDVLKLHKALEIAVHNLMRVYCESRIPTYGTIHEIVIASQQHKPIFMVWEGDGIDSCSAWLMKLIGYKNIFSNVDDLMRHLEAIGHGEQAYNVNEWLLLESI